MAVAALLGLGCPSEITLPLTLFVSEHGEALDMTLSLLSFLFGVIYVYGSNLVKHDIFQNIIVSKMSTLRRLSKIVVLIFKKDKITTRLLGP